MAEKKRMKKRKMSVDAGHELANALHLNKLPSLQLLLSVFLRATKLVLLYFVPCNQIAK